MRKALSLLILVMALASFGWSQTGLRAPVIGQSTTNVTWTAGTINNGGHAVAITAGTAALGASKTDCSSPGYAGCDFLIAGSTGTVSVTTSAAAASASGVTVLAYIETSAGSVATRIVSPFQNGALGGAIIGAGGGGSFSGGSAIACGTVAVCSPVVTASVRIVYGSVALASGTPSTATVTGISPAFTSTSTYFCTGSPIGGSAAIAAGGVAFTLVSGSSFTVTGPATVSTVINYTCVGS